MKRILMRTGLAALACVAAVGTGVALADGGTSIASAPELPIGQTVSGSVARLDFWRLTVGAGDQLVINCAALSRENVGLCFLQPSVTDFTLQDSKCWQSSSLDLTGGNTKRQTSRIFASGGRWTLVVGSNYCTVYNARPVVNCNQATQYQLTAYLQRATHMMLTTPALVVKRSSRFVLNGKVLGATSGNVAIQTRVKSRWVNIGVAKIGPTGGFTYPLRATKSGQASYRGFYPGDSAHRPSSAAIRVTVV